MSYRDPVLQKLIDVLNANGPAKLKNSYYQGDPVVIPMGSFPMCFISKDSTSVSVDTNHEDEHSMAIVLNVVYDGTRDLNQKAFAQAGFLGLSELCEGRSSDYDLLPNSIAGVLRSEQALDGNNNLFVDIGNELTIEYALSPPDRRGFFSTEAIIRTTIKHYETR